MKGRGGEMTETPSKGRWVKRGSWLTVAIVVLIYGTQGPYLFPVGWALGPCLKDWTSPSSYLPRLSALKTLDGPTWGRGDDAPVRICYGAPVARGRVLFGDEGVVPYGAYWRTGANEPTRLFTSVPLRLGSVAVEPGRYSLYTVPGLDEWEVVINRSTFHWGYDFSESVVRQEVGRTTLPASDTQPFADTLRLDWNGPARTLDLVWGNVRVAIPAALEGGTP